MLSTAKIICVRERILQMYLRELGVEKNVRVTIDTAFLDKFDGNM